MKNASAPAHFDVRALAKSNAEVSGRESLAQFPRIAEDCRGSLAERMVDWSARGDLRSDPVHQESIWLFLRADAVAPLTCQRCLEVVDVDLRVRSKFRFVADEETAAAQDDASEEDLLVLQDDFNLHELIEDELVLALPLVPHHEVCPGQSAAGAAPEFGEAVAGKPNPFAVLAELKSAKPGSGE